MHRVIELEAEIQRLRDAYDEMLASMTEAVAIAREERDRARTDAVAEVQREMAELRKRLANLEKSA